MTTSCATDKFRHKSGVPLLMFNRLNINRNRNRNLPSAFFPFWVNRRNHKINVALYRYSRYSNHTNQNHISEIQKKEEVMNFNIISEEQVITPNTNPLSSSIINFPQVESIGSTIYFNKSDTKLELNFSFSENQEQWKSDEVKLRSSLSSNINNLRKTPKTGLWSQFSDTVDSWYKQARNNAKEFDVQFLDSLYGHCKLEHNAQNEDNPKQTSWRSVPFIFASVGEKGMKNYVYLQFGNAQLNQDEKFEVETWSGVYHISKQVKSNGATEIWQQTYAFDWSTLDRVVIS